MYRFKRNFCFSFSDDETEVISEDNSHKKNISLSSLVKHTRLYDGMNSSSSSSNSSNDSKLFISLVRCISSSYRVRCQLYEWTKLKNIHTHTRALTTNGKRDTHFLGKIFVRLLARTLSVWLCIRCAALNALRLHKTNSIQRKRTGVFIQLYLCGSTLLLFFTCKNNERKMKQHTKMKAWK